VARNFHALLCSIIAFAQFPSRTNFHQPTFIMETLLLSNLFSNLPQKKLPILLALIAVLVSSCASSVRFTSAGGADYTMFATRSSASSKSSNSSNSSNSSAGKPAPVLRETIRDPRSPRSSQASRQAPSDNLEATDAVFWGGASYYGDEFHGRRTANGETYDRAELSAAHRTLPFGTMVKVKNLTNERTVIVRINDRGPFKPDRVIDVSRAAAEELGLIQSGTANVEIVIMQ
jgi:rare lipoprotein A